MDSNGMRPPDLFNKISMIRMEKRVVQKLLGRVVVDSHYIIFCPDVNILPMQLPICALESLERRIEGIADANGNPTGGLTTSQNGENNLHTIDIGFKTCHRWKLMIQGDASANEFVQAVQYRMSPKTEPLDQYVAAFHYTPPFKIEYNGWEVYDFLAESKRIFQHVDKKYHWKLTTLNADYSICASYPPKHYVPPYFDDLALKQVAAFRDGARFPAFSWIHPNTTASLCRCSQPLPGRLGGKRCQEDELLISQIFQSNPESPEFGGYILDARPYSSAMANRAMGAGFEKPEHYGGAKIEFLGIDNIHVVRDSLEKLKRAIRTALPGPLGPGGTLGSGVGGMEVNSWFDKLADSGWMKHLQNVLNGAVLAANLMHYRKISVIVHCSHGWDRTAQLTSLPMIMLDPYYRTFIGFQVLIEKEWVLYGHKFYDRCNPLSNPTLAAKEESPIFLQFLDAVHQIMHQFPTHFEFTEQLLIDIVDNLYFCQYGTFLANNSLHQQKLDLQKRTISLWTLFNHPEEKKKYMNPLYDAKEAQKDVVNYLRPSTAGNKLVFWDALFNRSDSDPNIDYILMSKCTELKASNDELKATVDSLTAEVQKLKAQLKATEGGDPLTS